jgi:hypothetical protein
MEKQIQCQKYALSTLKSKLFGNIDSRYNLHTRNSLPPLLKIEGNHVDILKIFRSHIRIVLFWRIARFSLGPS